MNGVKFNQCFTALSEASVEHFIVHYQVGAVFVSVQSYFDHLIFSKISTTTFSLCLELNLYPNISEENILFALKQTSAWGTNRLILFRKKARKKKNTKLNIHKRMESCRGEFLEGPNLHFKLLRHSFTSISALSSIRKQPHQSAAKHRSTLLL